MECTGWLLSFTKRFKVKTSPCAPRLSLLSVETLENTGKNAFSTIKRLYLISAKLFELSNQAVFTVEGLLSCAAIHIFCFPKAKNFSDCLTLAAAMHVNCTCVFSPSPGNKRRCFNWSPSRFSWQGSNSSPVQNDGQQSHPGRSTSRSHHGLLCGHHFLWVFDCEDLSFMKQDYS